MQADVAKAEDVKRMMRLTRDLFGSLDMLVNNAYFEVNKYIWEMDEEEFSSCVDVCIKSAFLTSKYVLHLMRKGEGGIINISSIHDSVPRRTASTTTQARRDY